MDGATDIVDDEPRGNFPLWSLVVGMGLLAGIAVLVSGNPIAGVAIPLALGLVYGIWKAPLRITSLALLFLVLILDAPSDRPSEGHWTSPLAPLGSLLLTNINKTIPIEALKFGLMD